MAPRPKSAKQEQDNFERVLQERFPAVKESSRRLQAMLGIVPGTKMLGQWPVMLYEMPDPPKDNRTLDAVLDEWIAQHSAKTPAIENKGKGANAAPQAGIAHGDDGGAENADAEHELEDTGMADGEFEIHGDAPPPPPPVPPPEIEVYPPSAGGDCLRLDPTKMMQRRQSVSQREPRPQHQSVRQKRKVLTELTESPVAPTPLPAAQRAQLSLQPSFDAHTEEATPAQQKASSDVVGPIPETDECASPPPIHETGFQLEWFNNTKHQPIYWSSDLSKTIIRWLEETKVRSAQTLLSGLELRSAQSPQCGISGPRSTFYAQDYKKLKIIRMGLPLFAQPAKPLDWIVVVVVHKGPVEDQEEMQAGDEDEDENDQYPDEQEEAGMSYLLLAFPIEAITAVKREMCSGVGADGASGPQIHTTTLLWGKKERVPLVHGHGVAMRVCDGFVNACAQGVGVLKLRSSVALPL